MKIRGAILQEIGRPRPYKDSKPLAIAELELHEPKSNELLLAIEAAGICHSDLSVVDGGRIRPVPMLLGHEACGLVKQIGSQVKDISVGDRVVLTFSPRCERCSGCASNGRSSCRTGALSNGAGELLSGGSRLTYNSKPIFHHLGVSGFATHAVVDRSSVVKISNHIPPQVGALLGCAILTGGGAILNSADVTKLESITVVGLGGVGLAGIITAKALGVPNIYAIDINERKLSIAKNLGATFALNPAEAIARNVSSELVLEAAGSVKAIEAAIDLTAPGGNTVLTGLTPPNVGVAFSPLKLVGESRRISGSYLGSSLPSRDIPYFIKLWESGKLPIESLISDVISLEEVNIGMDKLANGEALRQVIRF